MLSTIKCQTYSFHPRANTHDSNLQNNWNASLHNCLRLMPRIANEASTVINEISKRDFWWALHVWLLSLCGLWPPVVTGYLWEGYSEVSNHPRDFQWEQPLMRCFLSVRWPQGRLGELQLLSNPLPNPKSFRLPLVSPILLRCSRISPHYLTFFLCLFTIVRFVSAGVPDCPEL